MDLLTLVAHVTLDTSEYEKALDDVEREAARLNIKEDYSLDLDNKEFTSGLNEAQGEAEEFESNMNGVWDGIKTGLTIAGIGAAISGIFSQLSDCVNLAAKLGDNVDKGSRRLNISTEAYQEWGHALSQSGANINDLQRGILSINKLLGGGEVAKSAADAFDQLGISTTSASGGLKSTEEYLSDTIKALADFKGTKEERGALVEAIFGRSGNQLNALFDSGSTGIQSLIDEAHELGLVMTESEIASSVAYGDAVANMQSALEGLKTSFAKDILPGLTSAVEMVTKVVAFLNGRTDNSLADQFADADGEMKNSIADIEGKAHAAETLLDKILKMGDTSKMTAEQFSEWQKSVSTLIDLVPTLGDKIDINTGKIEGNADALRDNIQQWKELAIAQAKATALQEKREAIAKKIVERETAEAELRMLEVERAEAEYKMVSKINDALANNGVSDRISAEGDINEQIKAITDKYSGSDEFEKLLLDVGMAMNEFGKTNWDISDKREEVQKLNDEVQQGLDSLDKFEQAIQSSFSGTSGEAAAATSAVEGVGSAIDDLPDSKTITIDVIAKYPNLNIPGLDFKPHAKGAWSVPFDDYPALLHRDEMVLTASQARHFRNDGGGKKIDYNEIGYQLGKEIRKLARELNILMDGEKVGDLTTGRVQKNINASSYSRTKGMGG